MRLILAPTTWTEARARASNILLLHTHTHTHAAQRLFDIALAVVVMVCAVQLYCKGGRSLGSPQRTKVSLGEDPPFLCGGKGHLAESSSTVNELQHC